MQRELSSSTLFEFGYSGSFSRKLQYLMDLNQGVPSASGVKVPFPEFSAIQTIAGSGRANYNAFATKLQRRLSKGVTALISYTWSKSLDDVSAIRGQSAVGAQYPQDSNCVSCEKAVSDFHVPHRFVASSVYEIPVGKGRRYGNWNGVGGMLADGVIGGWQASSIVTIQAGLPYQVTQSSRASVNMSLNARVDATGVSPTLDNRDANNWLNKAAFAYTAAGVFGNEGRNVLTAPSTWNVDFSAIKNFKLHERHTLNVRFETFNFFNHPQWGVPVYSWGSSSATPSSSLGLIRGTKTSMRQIDLRSSPEGSLRDLLLLAEQRLCENSAGGNSSRSGKPSVSMQPIA